MTNAEARFNISLRPRKPEGSLGRTAQDVHLDFHTAPVCFRVGWGWGWGMLYSSLLPHYLVSLIGWFNGQVHYVAVR